MAPIAIEIVPGTPIEVGSLAWEGAAGELLDVGEAWYESSAGVMTRVFTTRRTDIRWNGQSFAPRPGGGWYLLNDANPSEYFSPADRDRMLAVGFDPNVAGEGAIHVDEGLYAVDANGANVAGDRIQGLPNRGPAAICVMPSGELVWASGDGDTLPVDNTIFNRYAVEGSEATLIANVDIYDTDPERNKWRHRVWPTPFEGAHIHVQSAAAWSDDEVLLVITERDEPFSTFVRYFDELRQDYNYRYTPQVSSFARDRIVRVGLHDRSFQTVTFDRSEAAFPRAFYGIATNGSDIWTSGTNTSGRWIISHIAPGSQTPSGRLFTPYANDTWAVDMHYVSPTEIQVLFAHGQGVPLDPIGSNNSFVQSFDPSGATYTWDPDTTHIFL